jgi:hypothetical protein
MSRLVCALFCLLAACNDPVANPTPLIVPTSAPGDDARGSAAKVGSAGKRSGAAVTNDARAREDDLATYRAGDGAPWKPGGANEAAMRVAARVFAQRSLVGETADRVRALLGPATVVEPSVVGASAESWTYYRGNGEIASIVQLEVRGGVVSSIRFGRSQ